MKAKKSAKIMLSLGLLALGMNFGSISFASVKTAQDELEAAKKEYTANQNAIKAVEGEVSAYLEQIEALDDEISVYEEKLGQLQSQVDSINGQVAQYEAALQDSAQLYNSAEDVYTTRLRTIYENGIPSVFEILVSSDGIGDFFSRLNVYTSVLEYDQSLIGNMKTQKEYVEYLKGGIEEGKLSLESLSYDVEKSAKELEDAKGEKQAIVNQLSSSKTKLQAASSILLAKREQAQAAFDAAVAEASKNTGTYSGYFSNDLVWPTTSSYLTAGFGWYNYGYHYGVDIGVGRGTSVFAAAGGTVITATTVTSDPNGPYTSWGAKDHSFGASNGYGYGNYIMIDNGKDSAGRRIYTLYGHLSSVSVRPGQIVAPGQVIGYSGNTGNSYGAHLHFEIRHGTSLSSAVNPMSYFN